MLGSGSVQLIFRERIWTSVWAVAPDVWMDLRITGPPVRGSILIQEV